MAVLEAESPFKFVDAFCFRFAFTLNMSLLFFEGRDRPDEDDAAAGAAEEGVERRDVSCDVKASELDRGISFFCRLAGRWP